MIQKKQSILEWYQKTNNYIDAPCGGNGNCGRCKIKFLSNPPNASEKDYRLLSKKEIEQGIRLACATEKTDREDFVRVGEWAFTAVSGVSESDENRRAWNGCREARFGVALDIGTTTIAMSLTGLTTGKSYGVHTNVNHQRSYGADVISRIQAANEGKLSELQKCIQSDILNMLIEIVRKAGIRMAQVEKIVIAANTTMCHLLLGYSCEGLGKMPFEPADISLTKISARQLFEKIAECHKYQEHIEQLNADVVILPGISAFVGADIVAGIYECDMDLKNSPHMLLDVGTNGEIAVGGKNGFLVTSAAAGPVFEGGRISCGMPAVTGAISHIRSVARGRWAYDVIGSKQCEDVMPAGFCGSGLVELAAALWKHRVIDENGTLCEEYFESGYKINLGKQEQEMQLVLTQSDIRELQMGKAAIRAGIESLVQKIRPKKIYLAGGFGTAINVDAAVQIGLFPEEYADYIVPAGNTALAGARKFLLDEKGAERVCAIAAAGKEMILAKEPDFEEKYIQFMQFLI